MTVKTRSGDLLAALDAVAWVRPEKSMQPYEAYVRLASAGADRLEASVCCVPYFATAQFHATFASFRPLVVQYEALREWVGAFPNSDLDVSVGAASATFRGPLGGHLNLPTADDALFPRRPTVLLENSSLWARSVRDVLKRVVYAMPRQHLQPLSFVLLDLESKVLTAKASNGRVHARAVTRMPGDRPAKVMAWCLVDRLAQAVAAGKLSADGELLIAGGGRGVWIHDGELDLYGPMMTGERLPFPDSVVTATVEMEVGELRSAVAMCGSALSNASSSPILLEANAGTLSLRVLSGDRGKSKARFEGFSGTGTSSVVVSITDLENVVDNLPGDRVRLGLAGPQGYVAFHASAADVEVEARIPPDIVSTSTTEEGSNHVAPSAS